MPDDSGDPSALELAKAWIGAQFNKPGRVFLGVVHRLDRPVSGVVAFGRTSKGAARLSEAFRAKTVRKTYLAVTTAPVKGSGTVEHWLLKDTQRNVVRVVPEGTPGAKLAQSTYAAIEQRGPGTLVELEPVTGRSHQLRVALASLGAPIAGDLKYGASAPLADKSIALHARRLVLPHPTRDEVIDISADPPANGLF